MNQAKPSREDSIARSALEVLATRPSASMAEIALAAGVGRATLYRYFPSRDALIVHLARQALDETDIATQDLRQIADPLTALHALFAAMVPLGAEYHFLSRCVVVDEEAGERYEAQLSALSMLVRSLQKKGVLSRDVPERWAVELIDSLIWMAWSSVARGDVTEAEAAELSVSTLLRGLGPAT